MAANVQGNPKLLPKPPAALCVGLPPWSPLPSPPSGPGSDNDVLFSDQTMPHLGSSVLLLTSARLPPRSLGCRTRSSKDPKSAGKNLMERRSWTYSKRAPRTTTALRRRWTTTGKYLQLASQPCWLKYSTGMAFQNPLYKQYRTKNIGKYKVIMKITMELAKPAVKIHSKALNNLDAAMQDVAQRAIEKLKECQNFEIAD